MNWPAPQISNGIRLSDAQRIDWLRLTRTESVGPLTFNALINRFGGASAALDALPDLLKKRGKPGLRVASVGEIERELEAARLAGVRFVALGEADYPSLLRRIDAAPPIIAVKGQTSVFQNPAVAIVGSRNASGNGRSFTERLAKGLTEHGFAIASGLARGIDTRAHEASQAFGTVAVLAGGIDRPYPAENVPLMERICEKGAIVSEMPMGWEPRGRDFPRRNRIISGLAYATIIVEAARKSGSLITARFALEQNREVFAVPGSPLDPRAEGTNDLIKNPRAHVCTSVDDVIREISPMIAAPDLFAGHHAGEEPGTPTYRDEPLWDELLSETENVPAIQQFMTFREDAPLHQPSPPPGDPTDSLARIMEALGPSPLDVDELARLAGVPLRTCQAILLDLDLAGSLDRHGGNRVSLKA